MYIYIDVYIYIYIYIYIYTIFYKKKSIEKITIEKVARKGGKGKPVARKGGKAPKLRAGMGKDCGKGLRKENPQ